MSDRDRHANLAPGDGGRLPWLTLSWAAAVVVVCCIGIARGVNGAAIRENAEASFEWSSWMASIGVLLGAVALAVPTALIGPVLTERWPQWIRALLHGCAKAVAFLPVMALAWAAIGYWAGKLGWPIESLLPAIGSPSPASMVWKWLAPVFVLAVPIAAEAAASALGVVPQAGRSTAWMPRLRLEWLFLLGAVNLVIIEDVFALEGATGLLTHSLRNANAAGTLSGLIVWLTVATAGGVCGWLLGRTFAAPTGLTKRADWDAPWGAYEGVVAIGMPPRQAWVRHVLPHRSRVLCCRLLTAAAWVIVWGTQIGAISGDGRGETLRQASAVALADPTAPLLAGLWPLLWALCLWLLGRILVTRPPRDRHD